eukprot:1139225-Pelagomonas_calceolata.AAC.2
MPPSLPSSWAVCCCCETVAWPPECDWSCGKRALFGYILLRSVCAGAHVVVLSVPGRFTLCMHVAVPGCFTLRMRMAVPGCFSLCMHVAVPGCFSLCMHVAVPGCCSLCMHVAVPGCFSLCMHMAVPGCCSLCMHVAVPVSHSPPCCSTTDYCWPLSEASLARVHQSKKSKGVHWPQSNV